MGTGTGTKITMMKISFESLKSQILINPKFSREDQARFIAILDHAKHLPGHLWIATSGTTTLKWVALSKEAILSSAQAINTHLEANASDVWIHCLPDFHVGGIGIWARSYLSHALVVDCKKDNPKWNAVAFYEAVQSNRGTLTALVPSQVYDLVSLGLRSPKSLRAVIVGGSRLADALYEKALDLGWNLLPSYGCTECASQIATAIPRNPSLKVLPHMQVKITDAGLISVKSPALLTTYAIIKEEGVHFIDPKEDGWFTTEDRGSLSEGCLKIEGRVGRVVKVGGENVNVNKLEQLFEEIKAEIGFQGDAVLIAIPDERLGHAIHLAAAHADEKALQVLIDRFHACVLPFERIRQIHEVDAIPHNALSKVMYNDLVAKVIMK